MKFEGVYGFMVSGKLHYLASSTTHYCNKDIILWHTLNLAQGKHMQPIVAPISTPNILYLPFFMPCDILEGDVYNYERE